MDRAKQVGEIISLKKEYSPIRTLLVLFLEKMMDKSRIITRMVLAIDDLTIKTIGKIFPIFDGGGIILIIKKQEIREKSK